MHRQPHQRADVGIHQAVAARHHHHFVFPGQPGHHLRHARVERARIAFEALQQRDLVGILEAGDRIMRQIDVAPRTVAYHRHRLGAALPGDRARGFGRAFQRVQADVVGIGERSLLAADRAHTDALVDIEAAGLDDAFLQRPAFRAAVLEIQVGVVEAVRQHAGEHLLDVPGLQRVRREQRALRGGEQRISGEFVLRDAHHAPCVMHS